jgi:O-antigen/teichoic acid export membrane protein
MKFNILNSSLLRSSGIYTAANMLNAAIPFFMLPILTRYLSPTDYGIVAMFTVMIGFFNPFIGVNIHGAINRQYFEKDTINLPQYIGNAFMLLVTNLLVISLIVTIFSDFLSNVTSFPEDWLWAVMLVASFQVSCQVVLVIWQVQVKPLAYGTFQVIQTLMNVSLTLYFVVILELGWQGRVEGQIIAVTVFGCLGLGILIKKKLLEFKINKKYIKHILKFGIPLIPHTVGAAIITMSDRVFITNMVGVDSTGIYTVGFQIGMIIGILQDSFNKAWVPWFFSKLKKDQLKDKILIIKITYIYFIVIVFVALILGLIAPLLLSVFVGPEFSQASQYVIWIAVGFAFNGMYKMVTNYIFYLQKTYILMFSTFGTAVLNVILNAIFIYFLGAIGAAIATSVSFFVMFIITWIIAAKLYKMPWDLRGNVK